MSQQMQSGLTPIGGHSAIPMQSSRANCHVKMHKAIGERGTSVP